MAQKNGAEKFGMSLNKERAALRAALSCLTPYVFRDYF